MLLIISSRQDFLRRTGMEWSNLPHFSPRLKSPPWYLDVSSLQSNSRGILRLQKHFSSCAGSLSHLKTFPRLPRWFCSFPRFQTRSPIAHNFLTIQDGSGINQSFDPLRKPLRLPYSFSNKEINRPDPYILKFWIFIFRILGHTPRQCGRAFVSLNTLHSSEQAIHSDWDSHRLGRNSSFE
jgi:hypothetical protein